MRTVLVLVLGASAVLLASAPRVAAQESLKIGIIAGTTGAFAEIGQGAVNAIQMGCDNWNARRSNGDTPLPKLECYFEDDGFDTKKGIGAFERLRSVKKIDALINVNSTTIAAIAPKVRASGLPTVQVFLEGGIPERDNIFQICPDMNAATEMFGQQMRSKFPDGIGLLLSTNDVITQLADAFERGYARRTTRMDIPVDQADVRSAVLKVLQQKPQALYLITVPAQGVLIEKELRVRGIQLPRIFDANFVSALSTYEEAFGSLDAFSDSPLLNLELSNGAVRAKFQSDYMARFNASPPPWTEFSTDAIEVLLAAYDPDTARWREKLQNTAYSGASGQIEFSNLGATKPNLETITVGELLKRRKAGS